MAGYSGTPLIKKLGIKAGQVVQFIGAPAGYLKLLGPLPEGVQVRSADHRNPMSGGVQNERLDFVQVFTRERNELKKLLPRLMKQMGRQG